MEQNTPFHIPNPLCLHPRELNPHFIANEIYTHTCRSDFNVCGVCVVNLAQSVDSVGLRRLMVAIKDAMASIHEKSLGETLIYQSAGRFDQQESTKLHLDGGPQESILMLGYEPTSIDSEFEIADFSKCAFDLGLSPQEFMSKHNPLFKSNLATLRPYTQQLHSFSKSHYQIICINNSFAVYKKDGKNWQGVLHKATILNPDESKRRVINSTMITKAPLGSKNLVDKASLEHFMRTPHLKRRGYDKLHLQDE